MTAFKDISTAPKDGTIIRVRTVGGLEFNALWRVSGWGSYGWWVAENKDEQPESWTNGGGSRLKIYEGETLMCFAVNDGKESDQPTVWKPA